MSYINSELIDTKKLLDTTQQISVFIHTKYQDLFKKDMNEEELFKQIMDDIKKKRSVNIADLKGLVALSIPAGTYANKCASLDEFLSEVYYFRSLRRNGIIQH